MKKIIATLLIAFAIVSFAFAAGATEGKSSGPIKIGVPDDPTNQGRAIKLLETAGLITVDPAVGFSPELKDIPCIVCSRVGPRPVDFGTGIPVLRKDCSEAEFLETVNTAAGTAV